MPKCWFVLLRFWLRVDDTILKIRETRYYCEDSESATVWRETKHVEGTFEQLAKGGAPSSNVCAHTNAVPSVLRGPVCPLLTLYSVLHVSMCFQVL